jgi:hypothetical protein
MPPPAPGFSFSSWNRAEGPNSALGPRAVGRGKLFAGGQQVRVPGHQTAAPRAERLLQHGKGYRKHVEHDGGNLKLVGEIPSSSKSLAVWARSAAPPRVPPRPRRLPVAVDATAFPPWFPSAGRQNGVKSIDILDSFVRNRGPPSIFLRRRFGASPPSGPVCGPHIPKRAAFFWFLQTSPCAPPPCDPIPLILLPLRSVRETAVRFFVLFVT